MIFGIYVVGLLLGALAGILWGLSNFEAYVHKTEVILDELMGESEHSYQPGTLLTSGYSRRQVYHVSGEKRERERESEQEE